MGAIDSRGLTLYTPTHSFCSAPICLLGTAVTNASGVARLYLTDDGTATGNLILKEIHSWSTDIESSSPVASKSANTGVNYIDVTIGQLSTTSVVILGISVIASVSTVPLSGATVKFIVFGM